MSAVFDTLKRDALRREASGFATMHGDPIGAEPQYGGTASTVGSTFVGSGAAVGHGIAIVYSTHGGPQRVGLSGLDSDLKLFGIVRSDSFVLLSTEDAATMGAPRTAVVVEAAEQHERGVVVLRMPRNTIHVDQVSVKTAQLPRKRPRVILSYRTRGEDDA